MRFTSLGSGSSGNALVVEAGANRIMIDCGFSLREVSKRLKRIDLTPEAIDAIFVTHEHYDHIAGVATYSSKHGTPVYMSHGTRAYLNGKGEGLNIRLLDAHQEIRVGTLSVLPFTVPHDAREPVQFVVSDGSNRLGVVTDLGSVTPCVKEHVSGLDALVLEANHDATMLRNNRNYPEALKQRIMGRYGHLENNEAAALLEAVDCSRLKHLVAAHLSQHNNLPDLARKALAGALHWKPEAVTVADQVNGFAWLGL